MPWKEIITLLLDLLARQGGWLAVVAAWLAELLLPLIPDAERFEVASIKAGAAPSAAPDEFKDAVKKYLLQLVNKIQRPLIRLVVRNVVMNLSDAILDQLWDLVIGGGITTMRAPADELGEAAVNDIAEHC